MRIVKKPGETFKETLARIQKNKPRVQWKHGSKTFGHLVAWVGYDRKCEDWFAEFRSEESPRALMTVGPWGAQKEAEDKLFDFLYELLEIAREEERCQE